MNYEFSIKGLDELRNAIKRNPQVVKEQVANFLTRATAVYTSTIKNSPWRVGMSGGGSPVSDDPRYYYGKNHSPGYLRDSHKTITTTWEAYIEPQAPYAKYVHKKRPWLEYAFNSNEKSVGQLELNMMEEIILNLTK